MSWRENMKGQLLRVQVRGTHDKIHFGRAFRRIKFRKKLESPNPTVEKDKGESSGNQTLKCVCFYPLFSGTVSDKGLGTFEQQFTILLRKREAA